jgi:hypothetical protein
VKLICIAEMAYGVNNKRKMYKKGYESEGLSVLGIYLRIGVVATRCYKCVLKYRKVSEFIFNIFL